MTARPIGDFSASIFNGRAGTQKKVHRTGQPVRRKSYQAGHREREVWRPIAGGDSKSARRWIAALLQAAEQFDRQNKADGKRNGALGHIALEVLRELTRMVDYKTGRLDPAIATLQARTRRSRAAVVSALARLKQHGFLQWIRRTETTDNEGGYGPQVKQITNAYGFDMSKLPKAAASLVRRLIGRAPPPDDDIARRAADVADTEAMLAAVPPSQQGSARACDPDLAAALNSLGRAVENASSLSGQNPGSEG